MSLMVQTTQMATVIFTWQACRVRVTSSDSEHRCTFKEAVKGSGNIGVTSMRVVFLFSNQTHRSSFDRSARLLASPGYTGLVCPRGHRMLGRLYTQSGRHCDMCESPLEDGDIGHYCNVCNVLCPRYVLLYNCFTPCFSLATMTCALIVKEQSWHQAPNRSGDRPFKAT
jgi:hypothetical protein